MRVTRLSLARTWLAPLAIMSCVIMLTNMRSNEEGAGRAGSCASGVWSKLM